MGNITCSTKLLIKLKVQKGSVKTTTKKILNVIIASTDYPEGYSLIWAIYAGLKGMVFQPIWS